MTLPLFDSQRFMQSLADDDELARELIAAFLDDSLERSSSLGEALDSGDAGAAVKLAHSLKGMCGVVRVNDLVKLALNMENAARAGDLAQLGEYYVEFLKKMTSAHAEMREYLA